MLKAAQKKLFLCLDHFKVSGRNPFRRCEDWGLVGHVVTAATAR